LKPIATLFEFAITAVGRMLEKTGEKCDRRVC
jgi:hypothetical protein